MPQRRHVTGAAELDALDAELGDAMHFLHRGGDVAERQAGPADHPLRMVAAEVAGEVLLDAQHLRRGAGVLQLRGGGEHAVDYLGVDAILVELLGAQVRVPRAADAVETGLIQSGLRHAVGAVLLAGLVFSACRADAGDQPEGGAVARDPLLAVRSFADERHPLLELARRLRGEEIRRQPDHIEMAIGRDSFVLHLLPLPTADQIISNRELLPMDWRAPSCTRGVHASSIRQMAAQPAADRSTGECVMARTVWRATSLATRSALLLSVRRRSAPEHCPQDADEEQRCDWPMEPDPVQTGENIDQNQKARNCEGHCNRARQVRQPIRDGARPRGWLVSVANPLSAGFRCCK